MSFFSASGHSFVHCCFATYDLSFAVASQVLKLMSHLVKLILHVSLYPSFVLSLDLFSCASSPNRSC